MNSQHYHFPKLRELREQSDLSGYDLAYVAGISTMSLYALETKATNPRVRALMYLAFALASEKNIPPSRVFREILDTSLFELHSELRGKVEKQRK